MSDKLSYRMEENTHVYDGHGKSLRMWYSKYRKIWQVSILDNKGYIIGNPIELDSKPTKPYIKELLREWDGS